MERLQVASEFDDLEKSSVHAFKECRDNINPESHLSIQLLVHAYVPRSGQWEQMEEAVYSQLQMQHKEAGVRYGVETTDTVFHGVQHGLLTMLQL